MAPSTTPSLEVRQVLWRRLWDECLLVEPPADPEQPAPTADPAPETEAADRDEAA